MKLKTKLFFVCFLMKECTSLTSNHTLSICFSALLVKGVVLELEAGALDHSAILTG